MSVTRPVVKTETLKKTKMQPAWVLASPWKVANEKVGTFTWAQAMGSRWNLHLNHGLFSMRLQTLEIEQ